MRTLAALIVAALLVAGCGDDDDTLAQTVTTTTVSTTTTTAAATSTTVEDPGPEVTDPAVADRDAQAIVVALEDLPAGWTPSPDEDEDDDDGSQDCGEGAFAGDVEPDAEASFQQGDFGPFLIGYVIVADDGDGAEDYMARFADAIERCDGHTDVDDDGTETTWQVSPLSFPNLGDATFAARLSTTTFLGPLAADVTVSRVDEVVVFTIHVALGGPDSGLTEQVQRTQVDRI